MVLEKSLPCRPASAALAKSPAASNASQELSGSASAGNDTSEGSKHTVMNANKIILFIMLWFELKIKD
jgi:hypothetical protein